MKLLFSLGSAIILLFTTISTHASDFPKTMPDDFSILYTSTGTDISKHPMVYLSLKECKAETRADYDSDLVSYSFSISKEELSSIYSALLSLNAFKLKSKFEKGHKRGGEEITYTIKGKTYVVRNLGGYFLIKKHLNHFKESVDLIIGCADRHKH